jgi:hypothetical protein
VEFFHRHWSTVHAEHALRITTIRRYVQAHRIGGVPGLPDAIYEGIPEVWFDDAETAGTMRDDPDYTEHAQLDEPNFIDLQRFGRVVSEQRVERAGPPIAKDDGGAKAMLLLKRDETLSPEAFFTRLAAARIADVVPEATRVTIATALPVSYADGADSEFDAIVELWFADVAAFTSAWGDGDAALEALTGIIDLTRSAGFLAEELRVRWPPPTPA